MGHWSGVKYTFKLNEEDSSYKDIVEGMQKEIDKKYIEERENPGERFGASMQIKRGKVIYESSSYKSRVDDRLSYNLLKKIEKNIDTNTDKYYYFTEDNGENKGAISYVYGYAQKVGQHLLDAGYADKYENICFYDVAKIDRFHDCIENKTELEVVIREGECERWRRELLGKDKKINEYRLYEKKTPESIKPTLDEKWLSYWLVYGTNHKYKSKINYYGDDYLNVKEYLFALDYNSYGTKVGRLILKELTRYGVEFKEGLDSVEARFKIGVRYDSSGHKVEKEEIEKWYQEHKEEFSEVPKVSKNLANYLKESYPETFVKLKTKLIELHHKHAAMQEKNTSKSLKI